MPEYFISNTGNNQNPGTIEKPFSTIQKCAGIAQAGDTCYIREGLYRETVTPANSGEEGRPITFQAYNGEKVVISGADIVEGTWQEHENGIYKITLEPRLDLGIGKNQIFVDGEMMIEARWPNIDNAVGLTRDNHVISSNGEILQLNQTENHDSEAVSYYQSSELNKFPEGFWDEGYISFVPGYEWWGNVGKAIGSRPGRVDFSFNFPSQWLKYHQPSENDPFYLWGIYDALDSEKEWFLDVEGKEGVPFTLYMIPSEGSLNRKLVEIKVRDKLFEIRNQSYIHLNDLDFFAGRILVDKNSHHNVINKIAIQYGADGKGLTAWVNPAIKVHGEANKLLNSMIRNTASSAIKVEGSEHIIRNNIIENTGYTSAVSDGIQIGRSSNVEVSYNTIFSTSSLGISSVGKKVKVTHNHIWNIGLQKTDTAAINSWNAGDAEGTEFAYNLVHDVVAYGASPKHYGGKGIRLDAGGTTLGNSNYQIHNNIVYKTTEDSIVIWGLKESYPNYGNAQNYIENNTVESIRLTDKENHSLAGTIVKNNISNKYRFAGDMKESGGAIVENNLFYLTDLSNNLQPRQFWSFNQHIKPIITEYFPLLESGEIKLPYRPSYIQNDGQAIGARPFVAGAVILDEDLLNLSAHITAENPDKLTISALPFGRKVPESFQVKLENGLVYSDCYNITAIGTVTTTVNCEINLQDIRDDRTVYVSLNGQNFEPISLNIDPSVTLPVPVSQAQSMPTSTMFLMSIVSLGIMGLAWNRKQIK